MTKIVLYPTLLAAAYAFSSLEDYHNTFEGFTRLAPMEKGTWHHTGASFAEMNATNEYITLQNGGAVWQLLTSREGGVAFTGFVNVGNTPLPTVIDTGSTSMICLSCRCPSCAGPRSSLYSACHGGDRSVHKRDCHDAGSCHVPSRTYIGMKDDLTFSYVSGSTHAKAAKERIEIRGHNANLAASVIGEGVTFYEVTQNALDVIKLGFFSCVMGVAAGCQSHDCKSGKCDGGCQDVFLHQFDNAGARYSVCLEGQKGWMIWNENRRKGSVEVQLLEYENNPGDLISQLWYTPLHNVAIGNHQSNYCRINNCISVFDSGTSLFMFPHPFEREISKSVSGIIRNHKYNCQAVWQEAPPLSFTLGGGASVSVSPQSYIGEIDASDFLKTITTDILRGRVAIGSDMKKRLSWLFNMRGDHPVLSDDVSGVFQRLKCLVGHHSCASLKMGTTTEAMATMMKSHLERVSDKAWNLCGVQVMTATEEYPHEFILGIPFFREYMVTFEMPLHKNGDSHSRSDFRDRRVYLTHHHGGCEFADRPIDDSFSLKREHEDHHHRPKLSSLVFPRTFRKLADEHQHHHHHVEAHPHSAFRNHP